MSSQRSRDEAADNASRASATSSATTSAAVPAAAPAPAPAPGGYMRGGVMLRGSAAGVAREAAAAGLLGRPGLLRPRNLGDPRMARSL